MKQINCFPDDTLVFVEEGDGTAAIDRLQVGDKVLSQCEQTGERAYKRITRIFEHTFEENENYESFDTVLIRFTVPSKFTNWPLVKFHKINGPVRGIDEITGEPYDYSTKIYKDNGKRALEVTPEHLIWVHDRGWTAARDIQPGDKLEIIDPLITHPACRLDPYLPHVWAFASERIQGTVTEAEPSSALRLYNLEVEDFHTYFAEEAGVWVCDSGRS